MPLISNRKTQVIDGLDWIPVVSTVGNLIHIFARIQNKVPPHSSYGLYLRKITVIENILQLIPIINIFVKAFHTYRNTRSYILDSVAFNGMNLQFAPIEFTDDFDVVHAAVSENGEALKFASERMRRDQKIIGAAYKQNKEAIKFALPPKIG